MNMRKIIAVLVAVLMLCSVLPLSVAAAPGDTIISKNFDDGSAFSNGSNENGYMVFDATKGDWYNVYLYANAIKSGTKYEITFDCKANKATNLNVKINNNWSGDTFKWTTNVTTEWATYTCIINPDELQTLTSTALLMFTSNATAANGAIYHIDNVVVKEYKDPALVGKVTNGDFETGSLSGWTAHQSTVISTAAAHSGSYGVNLKGNGGWGGMLNQDVTVEAGKSYEVSLWIKANAQGANVQIKDGGTSGNNMASKWYNSTSWSQLVWTVVPTTDVICFNFCGGGTGSAEDVYVDDIVVRELKDPSFDGYITNGDFETGSTSPWDIYSGTTVGADYANGGEYGMMLSGGGASYGGIANQNYTVEIGKTYVVRFDMKVVNAGVNVQIKNGGANVKGGYISKTDWATYTYEYTATATNSNINFCGSGISGTDVAYLDNVMVYEKVEQSNDGYIVNGTFDTGALTPWNNLWGSCTASVIVGGKDSTFALNIISGEWKHVRQENIAVEANTDYKISFYSKNVKNMNLLVKDAADTANITNKGIANSDDWALTEITFNTGDNTAILVSFMGAATEAYGTFDTVVMEKLHTCAHVETSRVDATCGADGSVTYTCSCGDSYTETIPATGEHVYFDDCSAICEACGFEREVSHNVIHVAAVEATCTAMGNIEYWYCDVCGAAWTDEACTLNTNLRAVKLPMAEHEYFSDCDTICVNCYEETREANHNIVHAEAVAPTCIGMGNLEYWYCDVCGMAWLDEACTMNTNLRAVKLAATGEHTYADDLDDSCDICDATREIVAPVIKVDMSVSIDVNGLAFRFEADVAGFAIKAGTYVWADYTNATYMGYTLIETGVIASNYKSEITIKGERMCDLDDETGKALFAYRIINIPADKLDVEITMKPYYIVEIDGEQVTLYGEEQTGSYYQVAID